MPNASFKLAKRCYLETKPYIFEVSSIKMETQK